MAFHDFFRENYFGNTFERNECNKLLKKIDKLREIIPEEYHIFVDTFESLNDVKESCFGFYLGQNYKETIRKLEKNWLILFKKYNVNITNKCHVIFKHVEEFIDRKKRPLGKYSEQVVEVAHQKLNQIWEWYNVKDVESELHGEHFLKCINHFNTFNI